MVIGGLPIGSVVRLGRYALGHMSEDMIDIDWIKVSKDNEFISQRVLLGMQFDAKEGWNANPNYLLSNVRQYMNSEQHHWYHPTHPDDVGPDRIMLDTYITINIGRYPGLLAHFSDNEIDRMEKINGDYMRLPAISDIIGGGLPYFKRHGKRAKPVDMFGHLALPGYRDGMYHQYYMTDDSLRNVAEMGRDGNIKSICAYRYSGVRPICKIKCDTEVIETGKNTYKINLLSEGPIKFFKETQSVDWLLGI